VVIPIGSLSSRLLQVYLPDAYRWPQIKIPVLLTGKLAVTYDNNLLTALGGTCTFIYRGLCRVCPSYRHTDLQDTSGDKAASYGLI